MCSSVSKLLLQESTVSTFRSCSSFCDLSWARLRRSWACLKDVGGSAFGLTFRSSFEASSTSLSWEGATGVSISKVTPSLSISNQTCWSWAFFSGKCRFCLYACASSSLTPAAGKSRTARLTASSSFRVSKTFLALLTEWWSDPGDVFWGERLLSRLCVLIGEILWSLKEKWLRDPTSEAFVGDMGVARIGDELTSRLSGCESPHAFRFGEDWLFEGELWFPSELFFLSDGRPAAIWMWAVDSVQLRNSRLYSDWYTDWICSSFFLASA